MVAELLRLEGSCPARGGALAQHLERVEQRRVLVEDKPRLGGHLATRGPKRKPHAQPHRRDIKFVRGAARLGRRVHVNPEHRGRGGGGGGAAACTVEGKGRHVLERGALERLAWHAPHRLRAPYVEGGQGAAQVGGLRVT